MALGFTFNNTHSGTMGVVFRSVDRTLLPAKRVTQYTIPGKSGTYDIADGYQNREISCEVSFIGEGYKYPGVRSRARAVAGWLSGEGLLVFDDEPEKAYSAKVIAGISIEQIAVTGKCPVTFLCGPFAESLDYNQQAVNSVSLTRRCPSLVSALSTRYSSARTFPGRSAAEMPAEGSIQ